MNEAEKLELKETIQELFKLFDENILIRNTDYDYDLMRFIKDGTRITNTIAKLRIFTDKIESNE